MMGGRRTRKNMVGGKCSSDWNRRQRQTFT